MNADESLAARFETDRAHLRKVAYRLVGSLPDAEDAVQLAWLKVSRADLRDVQNLTGWFTTVTARECLSLLRVRRRRREVPLPDEARSTRTALGPAVDEEVVLVEEVGLALLVVLDRLSPAQRAAFVLHDLFAVPFDEVGRMLDRSPVAAKKLASRARGRVHGQTPRAQRLSSEDVRLVEVFLAASRSGDIDSLLDLLAPDVVRRVDRELVPKNVATEVRGARTVAEETKRFAAWARAGAVALIDGAPGIVIAPQGRLLAVLRLTIGAGQIHRVDIIGGTERLEAVTIALPPA